MTRTLHLDCHTRHGQTTVEYVLLMAVVIGVIFLVLDTMRTPILGFLETISRGFQGVVRYGERRDINAERVFENEHPGNPVFIVPGHL